MCCGWLFADAWLADPEEETARLEQTVREWEYVPTTSGSRSKAQDREQQSSAKASSKKIEPKAESPAISNSKSRSTSLRQSTCKMAFDDNDQHWPDDETSSTVSGSVVAGYNSHNGRRQWDYLPADNVSQKGSTKNEEAKPQQQTAPPPVTYVSAPPPALQQSNAPQFHPLYYPMSGPTMQHAPVHPWQQYPQMPFAYPAPAYYGLPQMGYLFAAPGNPWPTQPVAAPEEVKKGVKKAKREQSSVYKWQGRTTAEVEEDNMKIAAREGVCDSRKVEPKGLNPDQMVWCVELDGSHTLRAFAAVQELTGEWKQDPRFKDSWYFVRQEEGKQ